MGSYYQEIDHTRFNYDLQALPGISKEKFRGPALDPSRPYVACIGAAQTFGRFCTRPFPSVLSVACDFQFLNLAVGGAGPRLFDTPEYLNYLNKAEFVIVQIMAGRSEGNSLFDNSASGDLYGIRLKDKKRMRFEDFLSELRETSSLDLVTQIVRETQDNYVRSYIRLLNHINRPKLLLWLSNRSPDEPEDLTWETVGHYPQLVNRSMVERVRHYADGYVECVSTAGIPQQLWIADKPIDGARLENNRLMNYYYPSPIMHMLAAQALEPLCHRFLPKKPSLEEQPAADVLPGQAPVKFIILAAERTGSDLLRTLLQAHHGCFVAHELFNEVYFEKKYIPWFADPLTGSYENPINFDPELVELREKDPGKLIERLTGMSSERNFGAAGFKLMYYHGDKNPAARDYLVGALDVRVIHLKRRNLLRRLVSLKRAQLTQGWNYSPGSDTPELPPVELSLMQCIGEFCEIEKQQDSYDQLFKDHAVLTVYYEDLSKEPEKETARAAAFLGLPPQRKFENRLKKLGTDALSDAIPNYTALKGVFHRWAACFDE